MPIKSTFPTRLLRHGSWRRGSSDDDQRSSTETAVSSVAPASGPGAQTDRLSSCVRKGADTYTKGSSAAACALCEALVELDHLVHKGGNKELSSLVSVYDRVARGVLLCCEHPAEGAGGGGCAKSVETLTQHVEDAKKLAATLCVKRRLARLSTSKQHIERELRNLTDELHMFATHHTPELATDESGYERNRVAYLASKVKVPSRAPRIQAWYIPRSETVEDVCARLGVCSGSAVGDLGDHEEPRMVGLAGPTGCGKSTVTSRVVAREDVRAYFRDGIVWLPVRGKGAEHRLPDLMLLLANMVYETVLKSGEASWSSKQLRPPRTPGGVACDRENGAAYIRGALGITSPGGEEGDGGGGSHEQRRWRPRYLIVADDVYEPEVLEELQGIGAWVLYTTTRSASFIRRNGERSEADGDGDGGDHADVLRLDNISDAEGETVLRRASGLDAEAELPQPALDLIKSYGSVVMDLAYIGRWGVVHGTTDVKAWEVALNSVFLEGGEGGQEWTRRRWHTAVLFAGMADLARLNGKAKDLYLSLAVLPKGLSFTPTDAAALLFGGGGDTKAAKAATPDLGAVMEILGVLERCSVLFLEEGGRYCMHGSHADFVRELISCFPLSRKRALGRWREHASTPAALFAWPVEDSVRIQWALSSLDDAVEPPPPPSYDAMLDGMDQSDADTFSTVLERVAQVQALAGNLEGAHGNYTRLVGVTESKLEREAAGGGDSISQAGAELLLADRLHNLGMIAGGLGSTEEAFACHGRARSIREERLGASHPDAAHSLQALAACAAAAGKPQDEEWYLRRALSSWTGEGEDGEGGGGGGGDGGSVDLLDRWDVARTLHTLGGNSLKAGRTGEATELFRRALRWWEDALGQGCTNAARALHSLGVCAYDAGEVGEAAEFYRRALRVRVERLGPRHPDVAVTMHSLGVCEWKAGRPDEAEVLYQQTLSIRVEALGVEHPHVARTLHSLGGCARHAGRDGDAMALYQRALDIQEAMLGPCHPEVAATLHEMGVSAFGAGRMEQAESHLRRALSIKELTAGAAGGPGTFTLDMAYTLHDLGGVIFAFGDSRVAEAEEVFLRALEIRESLEASLDAASTLQCLAECARARGSGDGGLVSDNRSSSSGSGGGGGGSAASQEGGVPQRLEEGFLRRALAIQERELGRDHVYVAYTLFQLGRCLCSAGPAAGDGPKTEEGLAAFARSLEVRERELGRNHEDVLRTLHYLAACVSAAGRVGEAAEYYRRAVATEELTLGAEHPSVARSLHLFGACVLKAGRIDEGIELLRRALAIPEKQEQEQEEGVEEKKEGGNSSRSGDHHLDVALTMQQVAVCAADAGRTEDADALFREVLAIEERKLGADHLDVADTLSNLGECALKAGRTKDASEYYERALKIEEDKFGTDQPVLGSTLHHLGLCAEQDGRTDEAEELFRRALAIEEKQMGADHPNVAATLAGLGANALASGKKEEAESMLKRALAITDKAGCCGSSDGGGGYSGEVSTGPPTPPAGGGSEGTLHTLAECARKNGNYEDALRLLERALKIEEGGDDRGDSSVAGAEAVLATLRKLASWAGEAGRDGEAEAWYRRVLALEEEQLGEGHRDVAATLVLLGRCLSRGQARVEEAANLYRRALEIVEEEEGDRSLQVTSILLDIGLCALMLGRVEEAEVLYTRARTIEAEHLGGSVDEVHATALTLEMFVPRAPV